MEESRETGAILVLGMERSGTSMMAEVIHRWGAFGGPTADLTHADEANPRGYYEHPVVQQMMRQINQVIGRFWHPGYDDKLRESTTRPEFRDKAQALVEQMQRRARVWFWKEPLIAVTLPFWKPFLPDPVYIIPVRNPYESALSWQKYSLPPELQGRISIIHSSLLRWYVIMKSALAATESSRRKIFVSYEALIQSPEEQCRRLCRFLDAQFGLDEGSEQRIAKMVEGVDPSLHRNRSTVPFCDMPQPIPEEKELYRVLLRKIEDPDAPFDPSQFPLPPIYQEYLDNVQTFGEFYRRARPAGTQWSPRAAGR